MVWTEREVKKANRELSSLLSNMDGPLSRLEVVQKRYTELLSDMKRTEREHQKAKKRGDQLQKEKDAQRSELNKVTTMKDKLDKLSAALGTHFTRRALTQLNYTVELDTESAHQLTTMGPSGHHLSSGFWAGGLVSVNVDVTSWAPRAA